MPFLVCAACVDTLPPPPPASPSAPAAKASAAPSASPQPAPSALQPTPQGKVGARHVLIQWMGCERAASSVVRTRDQALAVAEDVLKRAKRGDDFARLAVEFSDEPHAAARGGSLGVFGHGQMVQAFDTAVFALKPGEISDIVETSFGFHVIQRTQ